MSKERWKTKSGFSKYKISDNGSVKSIDRTIRDTLGRLQHKKEKILKPKVDKDGYYAVYLYDDNGKVHYCRVNRLVGELFIPNPNNLPVVNHKDGVKKNNLYTNLEWATVKENNDHAIINKLINTNIPIVQYTLDGDYVDEYPSTRKAEEATGIDGSSINKVCRNDRKTAGGFIWKYK